MKLTLTLEMNNAAFDDGNEGRSEAARILMDAADKIGMGGYLLGSLRDYNGNTVGRFDITEEGE